MKKYFLHIPTWIHIAVTCYGINKKDALKRFKHQHGINRMPNKYAIWEA
jgi:hypothetical protein